MTPPGATIAGYSVRARADMGTSVTRADDQELQGKEPMGTVGRAQMQVSSSCLACSRSSPLSVTVHLLSTAGSDNPKLPGHCGFLISCLRRLTNTRNWANYTNL